MKQLQVKLDGDRDCRKVFLGSRRDALAGLARSARGFARRFHGLRLGGESLRRTLEAYNITVDDLPREQGEGLRAVGLSADFPLLGPAGRPRLSYPPKAAFDSMLPDSGALVEMAPWPAPEKGRTCA